MEPTKSHLLLTEAVNEAVKENPKCTDSIEGLLDAVSKKFLDMKLNEFPTMCGVMWFENKKKMDLLRKTAKRGKFDVANNTETFWSDNYEYCIGEDIPMELYTFMRVFVYKDFWNIEKFWRPFVKAICNRKSPMTDYEAQNLLIKTKMLFGSGKEVY